MMKTTFSKIILLITMILCIPALTACDREPSPKTSSGSTRDDTGFAMGTVVNQTIYASGNEDITGEVLDLLTQTESKWISWRKHTSEIGKINAYTKKGGTAVVTNETRTYLSTALSISRDSNGAFDPTIGLVTRLWGFDNEKNTVPAKEEINHLIQHTGYKNISLQGNKVNINCGILIDLGAIGKGIGCDEVAKMLDKKKNVTGALINIGGSSILTYGEKDNQKAWSVAITDPNQTEDFLGVIEINGTKHISTSGDYEKYFEKGGKTYHHILDPSTGYPAKNDLRSVTVVSDTGAVSDGLSTASFVLGKAKGRKLLDKYNAEGIFVDKKNRVYVTDGLKHAFRLLAEDYQLQNQ